LVIAGREYHPGGRLEAYMASLNPLFALSKATLPLASNDANLIVSAPINFSVGQLQTSVEERVTSYLDG